MAHYDCSNCGVYGGVDFGYCKDCTPPEYFDLKGKMSDLRQAAEGQWNAFVREELKALEERKTKFIANVLEVPMGVLEERLHELCMKHDSGYRYRHEAAERKRMIHAPTGEEIFVEPGAQIPLFPGL